MTDCNFQIAVETLSASIQADSELAWAWHCNIAMPIYDSGVDIETANEAAARVMKTLFHVDTAKIRDILEGQMPDKRRDRTNE